MWIQLTNFDVDVGYEGENPQEDWYVTVTIPKQDNWEDTRNKADEVATKIKEILNG